jgi:F-box and WD-40 domain protein CDC4
VRSVFTNCTPSSQTPMAARYTPPRSLGQHRASLRDSNGNNESPIPRSVPVPLDNMPPRGSSGATDLDSTSHPKPLPTPSKSGSPLPSNLFPSAPASPPTPAPSPTPHHNLSGWRPAEDDDGDVGNNLLLKAQIHFSSLGSAQRQKFLVDILNLCDNQQLSFISSVIGPRLRKDPFQAFPNEICLRVRPPSTDIVSYSY